MGKADRVVQVARDLCFAHPLIEDARRLVLAHSELRLAYAGGGIDIGALFLPALPHIREHIVFANVAAEIAHHARRLGIHHPGAKGARAYMVPQDALKARLGRIDGRL